MPSFSEILGTERPLALSSTKRSKFSVLCIGLVLVFCFQGNREGRTKTVRPPGFLEKKLDVAGTQ